jgi:hypothetical protein
MTHIWQWCLASVTCVILACSIIGASDTTASTRDTPAGFDAYNQDVPRGLLWPGALLNLTDCGEIFYTNIQSGES